MFIDLKETFPNWNDEALPMGTWVQRASSFSSSWFSLMILCQVISKTLSGWFFLAFIISPEGKFQLSLAALNWTELYGGTWRPIFECFHKFLGGVVKMKELFKPKQWDNYRSEWTELRVEAGNGSTIGPTQISLPHANTHTHPYSHPCLCKQR